MRSSLSKFISNRRRKEKYTADQDELAAKIDYFFEQVGMSPLLKGNPGELAKYAYIPLRIMPSSDSKLYLTPGSKSYLTKSFDEGFVIDRNGRIMVLENRSLPTMLIPSANKHGANLVEQKINSLPRLLTATAQFWTLSNGVLTNVAYPDLYIDAETTPANNVKVVVKSRKSTDPRVVKQWNLVPFDGSAVEDQLAKTTDKAVKAQAKPSSPQEAAEQLKALATTTTLIDMDQLYREIRAQGDLNSKQDLTLSDLSKAFSAEKQLNVTQGNDIAAIQKSLTAQNQSIAALQDQLKKLQSTATPIPAKTTTATKTTTAAAPQTTPAKTTTQQQTPPAYTNTLNLWVGKPFRILNTKNKSYCLDSNYKQNGGGEFHLWTVVDGLQRNQIWTADASNRLISWENRNSIIYAASNPTIIGIAGNAKASTPSARWILDSDGTIRSEADPAKVFTVAKHANGSKLTLAADVKSDFQHWTLQEVAMPAHYKLSGNLFVAGEPNNDIKNFKNFIDKEFIISCVYNPEFIVHAMNVQNGKGGDLKNDLVGLWTPHNCNHTNIRWVVDKYGRILLASNKAWCLYAQKPSTTCNIILKKVADLQPGDMCQYWQLDDKLIRNFGNLAFGMNVNGGVGAIKNNATLLCYKLSSAGNEQFAVNEYVYDASKCCLMFNNKYIKNGLFTETNISNADRFSVVSASKPNFTVKIKSLRDNKYICAEDDKKTININRDAASTWETFLILPSYNGYVLKTVHNTYVAINDKGALVQVASVQNATPIKKVNVEKYTYRPFRPGLKPAFTPSPKKSLVESFTAFFTPKHTKECAGILGGVDTTVTNTDTTVNTTTNNSVYNAVVNNKDLYTEMRTNIEKANEIVNQAKNEINKKTEAAAKAESKQSNKMTGKSFSVKNSSNVSFSLSNKSKVAIQLMVYAECISQLDSKKYNKAMIADMVGMTASSDTLNTAAQKADAEATAKTSATVDTGIEKYVIEKMPSLFGVDTTVTNTKTTVNNESNTSVSNITSNDTTERQIQDYCEHLSESTKNIDENVQNLAANLAAVAKVDQSNEFSYEEVEIDNAHDVNIDMLNESDQQLIMEYKELMNQIAQAVSESEIADTTTVSGDMTSKTQNDSSQEGTAKTTSDVSTDVTTKVSNTTGIIIAVVIGIVVLIIVIVYAYKRLRSPTPEPSTEPISDLTYDTDFSDDTYTPAEEPLQEQADALVEKPISTEPQTDTQTEEPIMTAKTPKQDSTTPSYPEIDTF